jgi:hypothetical protein
MSRLLVRRPVACIAIERGEGSEMDRGEGTATILAQARVRRRGKQGRRIRRRSRRSNMLCTYNLGATETGPLSGTVPLSRNLVGRGCGCCGVEPFLTISLEQVRGKLETVLNVTKAKIKI